MLSCAAENQFHKAIDSDVAGLGSVINAAAERCACQASGATGSCALDVFDKGCNSLALLLRLLSQTTELYRAGDDRRGRESFLELILGMEGFVTITTAIDTQFEIDSNAVSRAGQTIRESVNSLNCILMDIISAQEQRDLVLQADLLEYELAPQLEHWLEIFSMFVIEKDNETTGITLHS